MKIKILEGENVKKTRTLYEKVFQDSKAYTEYFYRKAEEEGIAFVATDGECIVAEVFLMPKFLSRDDRMIEAYYVYGVATDEAYRKRGIVRVLMENADQYARKKGVELMYLIPENEKIYRSMGFETYKIGEIITYELSAKDANTMLKFNLEPLNESNFNDDIYHEINELENEIQKAGELVPFRDKDYIRDKIERAKVENGEIYLLRKRNDYSIAGIIMTGNESEQTSILDIMGEEEKKEGLIKDFMRWKGIVSLKEYRFPVMIKILNQDLVLAKTDKIYLNDEI